MALAAFALGLSLQGPGRFEEAAEQLRQVLRTRPDYAEACNTWGTAPMSLGRPEDAVKHVQAAPRVKTDYATVRQNLRRVEAILQQKGQPPQP